MPTRITVRYLGSEVGKKVARPDTKGELLELAAKRLNLSTPALRVFAEGGTWGSNQQPGWGRVPPFFEPASLLIEVGR